MMNESIEVARSLRLRHGDLELHLADYSLHSFHRVPTYFFRMMSIDRGEEMGNINLRIGSSPHIERYAGHIGYGVHPAYRGHHYASRSLVLLLPFARSLASIPCGLPVTPTMSPRDAASSLPARSSWKLSMSRKTAESANTAENSANAAIGCRFHPLEPSQRPLRTSCRRCNFAGGIASQ